MSQLPNELFESALWGRSSSPIWPATLITFHRNLNTDAFPHKLTQEEHENLLQLLRETLSPLMKQPIFLEGDKLSSLEREYLHEHFFVTDSMQNKSNHMAYIIDKDLDLLVMIHGEDHLILRSLDVSSDWDHSKKKLKELERALSEQLPLAFSKKLGYLTADLGKCGCALTCQAILHLPALIQEGQFETRLQEELGNHLLASGLGDFNQGYLGDVVVLQNAYCLGVAEEDIYSVVHQAATKLVSMEKAQREELKVRPAHTIQDKVSRAYGLLRHSLQLMTPEVLSHLSFLKLGSDLGYLKGLTDQKINEIFFHCRPAHLTLSQQEGFPQEQLPQKRAQYLQSVLKNISLDI